MGISGQADRFLKLKILIIRLILIIAGTAFYFLSQLALGNRLFPTFCIEDKFFEWTAPINQFLQQHPGWTGVLLGIDSIIFDVSVLFLLLKALFGPTFRPFVALLLFVFIRLIMQVLCPLQPPPDMIWHKTLMPSLFQTYGTINDFFFSGHLGIAVLAVVELYRMHKPKLVWLGIALTFFLFCILILLRLHYTMDLYAGIVTALFLEFVAQRFSRHIDSWLGKKGEKC